MRVARTSAENMVLKCISKEAIPSGHQVPIFSYFSANFYFLLFFSKIPIFSYFSANLQLNFSFQFFFPVFIFFSVATCVLKELCSGKISPMGLFG